MNADFSEMRLKMVDGQIRTTDVTNPAILLAMGSVPRERSSMPGCSRSPISTKTSRFCPPRAGPARHLMQPSPFAKLVQLAEIAGGRARPGGRRRHRLLGRRAIAALGAEVVALESDPALADRAEAALAAVGAAGVRLVRGALDGGSPADAPFDVILVEGAVDEIPEHLLEQLAEGGRLVTVEGQGNAGVARVYLKDNGLVTGRRAFNAAVKPLPGFERAEAFEF